MPNLRQKADPALKASLHLSESQLQVQQMKPNQKSRQSGFLEGIAKFPHNHLFFPFLPVLDFAYTLQRLFCSSEKYK